MARRVQPALRVPCAKSTIDWLDSKHYLQRKER
jgi:hypothetical protein